MRMDLEAVALAIDRLHAVAPQLHDQRVELKSSKREQMERARLAGPSKDKETEREKDGLRMKVRPGKERESEEVELDRMLALIGKASGRKMLDQAVVLDGGMQAKLEQARQRDREKVRCPLCLRSHVSHCGGKCSAKRLSRGLPGILIMGDYIRKKRC